MRPALTVVLERINRTLAECDARSLPPLTNGTAAAAIDLVEQAGLRLDPWQRQVMVTFFADPDAVHDAERQLRLRTVRAGQSLTTLAPARRRRWWPW